VRWEAVHSRDEPQFTCLGRSGWHGLRHGRKFAGYGSFVSLVAHDRQRTTSLSSLASVVPRPMASTTDVDAPGADVVEDDSTLTVEDVLDEATAPDALEQVELGFMVPTAHIAAAAPGAGACADTGIVDGVKGGDGSEVATVDSSDTSAAADADAGSNASGSGAGAGAGAGASAGADAGAGAGTGAAAGASGGDTAESTETLNASTLLHRTANWTTWDGGKAGGKPVWLDPEHIPKRDRLLCDGCGKQMVFLLQVCEWEHHRVCHRLHVHVCGGCHVCFRCMRPWMATMPRLSTGRCMFSVAPTLAVLRPAGECKHWHTISLGLFFKFVSFSSLRWRCLFGSVVVLRCQLPQENDYYPATPPKTVVSFTPPRSAPSCAVCGVYAPNTCARCGLVRYCCRDHQTLHWKTSHSASCRPKGTSEPSPAAAPKPRRSRKRREPVTFTEWAVEVETEMGASEREAARTANDAQLLKKFGGASKGVCAHPRFRTL